MATVTVTSTQDMTKSGTASVIIQSLALLPPMGWNNWYHYNCVYTDQTILDNANLLVTTGLAALGYKTVTIDDCWMLQTRDAQGNLQVDPVRFPLGMKPVADTIHQHGLKFGIYEDAGYETCATYAGSGQPNGGGNDHFVEDTQLFTSWGVDYLKLDGCNVYVWSVSGFQTAYAAESAALNNAGRPIIFSESAPASFDFSPEWYDVLTWVRDYGQLWRTGDDIGTYYANNPDQSRFGSVLWNYAYNLPLGRFQRPGNWNDPDFIIGGDGWMSLAETRSQMALWSMMSSPLILSVDVSQLSQDELEILGNQQVIAIDQDPLGQMANLVSRNPSVDILFKPLSGEEYAVAVLNRSDSAAQVQVLPAELGFTVGPNCSMDAQNLWSGELQSPLTALQVEVASHDTEIWRVQFSADCGTPTRTGAIIMTLNQARGTIDGYTRCLASSGAMEACSGIQEEAWTVTARGALMAAEGCLTDVGGKAVVQICTDQDAQHWNYSLVGNLMNQSDQECLTADSTDGVVQSLSMQSCGHNLPNQIWSLPI
jgi:alpha-galactosidase